VTSSLTLWNHYTDYNSGSNIITDRSGNNNTAIVSGSTLTISGSLGLALSSSYNFFTYPLPLNATPDLEYTLQYYGSLNLGVPGDGNTPLWQKADGYNNGWYTILLPEPAGPGAQIYYRTGQDTNINFTAEESTLQMITLVCSTITNNIQIYINTSSIGFTSGSSPVVPFNSSSTTPFRFADNLDAQRNFVGTVRDIVVYSKVLTQAEVITNYNGLSTL
jgi:hypothetical protein